MVIPMQHGINYAVNIVKSHFGNLVAKVCSCLLRKGPLSLMNLISFTSLSSVHVTNSLLILIQHNCVQAFVPCDAGHTQYIALFENIISRTRFPKFLAAVSQEFDKLPTDIFEWLLQHGRLTLNQLTDRAESSQIEDLESVQKNLQKLIEAGYVECSLIPEPVVEKPTAEEASAKKRGAKSAKVWESETLQHKVLSAATPVDEMRFSFPIHNNSDIAGFSETDPPENIGNKRKYEKISDIRNEDDDLKVLWRVNFGKFNCYSSHKACIDIVREKFDDGAASIISTMLEVCKHEDRNMVAPQANSLSSSSIYEELIKREKGSSMSFDRVRMSLLELSSPPALIREVDGSYSLDAKRILELARNEEIESIVLKKYGRDAYRIFRLLSNAGLLLETDKIAEKTFVGKKEVVQVLYKLWQDDLLIMEKVAAGSSSYLLWKVNRPTLNECILEDMFHASLNLNLRLSYELDKHKEILNMPRELEKLVKVRNMLFSSLMKLDNAILLFS